MSIGGDPQWPFPAWPGWPGYYQPTQTGWVCPKCHAANAPHINQCPCSMTPLVPTVTTGAGLSGSTETARATRDNSE